MIPFLMSLMCITGLHQKSQCPTQTPISSHQLDAIWNPTSPYEYISSQYDRGFYTPMNKPVDLKALHGRKLKIAAILDPPYVDYISTGDGNGNLTGNATEVLRVLRETLGFDYEIVSPADGLVGMYNEKTGKWNGIMEMLINGDADLSIHMMSMLPIRTRDVEFSRPLGHERWVIMMQRPDQTTDGDGLTIPFQREVWYCLFTLVFVMCPLAYAMVRIRTAACRNIPGLSDGYSFGHCVWFIYGALLKQGSILKPVADSTRILFVSWWMFITILTGFYTANLTAYLTLSKVHIPFNGMDTIGYRKYWTARAGDTIHQVIAAGPTPNVNTSVNGNDTFYLTTPPYREFGSLRWADAHNYGTFLSTLPEMVERVRGKGVLLFEEENRVTRAIYGDFLNMTKKQTILQKRCTFMKSIIPVFEIPYGFTFSPLTANETLPVFGPILDKMTEFGLWDYYRELGLPVRDPCDKEDKDFRERKMRNGDLLKTYILCSIGYGLSLLTFLLEQLHRCFFRPKAKIHFFDSMAKGNNMHNKMLSFSKGKGSNMNVSHVQTIKVASAAVARPPAMPIGPEFGNGDRDQIDPPRYAANNYGGFAGLQPAYYTYGS